MIEYRKLLEEKIFLFYSYRNTTLKMKEVLDLNDHSVLQNCIRKRQGLIGQIDRIDNSILALNLSDKPGNFSGDKIDDEVVLESKNLEKLLVDISELDNQCIILAQTERNKLKDGILSYQKRRKGVVGYRSSGDAPARFVDTQIR